MIYIDADQYPPLVRWAVFNAIKTRLNCTPLSEQDLDDMLQEAWIAVDRYKDKPRGYQFTAARHAALNYFFKYILARKHSSKAENINQPSIWEKRVSFEETLAENGDETVSHQPPTYNHRPPLPLQGPALRAFLQTLYKSYATGQFKHATARAKKDALLLLLLSQGHNNEGIAHEMGTTPNNISGRRRRLVATLKAELNKEPIR